MEIEAGQSRNLITIGLGQLIDAKPCPFTCGTAYRSPRLDKPTRHNWSQWWTDRSRYSRISCDPVPVSAGVYAFDPSRANQSDTCHFPPFLFPTLISERINPSLLSRQVWTRFKPDDFSARSSRIVLSSTGANSLFFRRRQNVHSSSRFVRGIGLWGGDDGCLFRLASWKENAIYISCGVDRYGLLMRLKRDVNFFLFFFCTLTSFFWEYELLILKFNYLCSKIDIYIRS